jgi:hypothetical protein
MTTGYILDEAHRGMFFDSPDILRSVEILQRGSGTKPLILSDPTTGEQLLVIDANATPQQIAAKIGPGIPFTKLSVDEVTSKSRWRLSIARVVEQGPQPVLGNLTEWARAVPASIHPSAYSHPSVSTPRAVDDSWASDYKTAHPGAYDTTTAPPNGAGPGGPVTVIDRKVVKSGNDYGYIPDLPQYR